MNPSAERTRQLVMVSIGTVLTLAMGAVLIFGFKFATQLRASVTALQSASALEGYPEDIRQNLESLRDKLDQRGYPGQALASLSRRVKRFKTELTQLDAGGFVTSPELERVRTLWGQFEPIIEPVISFTGQTYIESDEAGSSFTKEGRAFFADVRHAELYLNDNNLKRLVDALGAVSGALQRTSVSEADLLRNLLSLGVAATFLLAIAAAYFQRMRARHERAARAAQEQTRDILKTVREGFFLLDADYRIGTVWSEALTRMFGRTDFAGLAFEELLQNLVPPQTLGTAMKYIRLLWGDRAHENLMKSINPLGQLEITTETASGAREQRYLQFDFHRVTDASGAVKDVLCSVADVTASVMMEKELQESQENASQQLNMVLGILQLDPAPLVSFLDATETGLRLINAIMREPARQDAEFRKKLGGLFRELHSIKGEAAALSLTSIARRVHALEDMVSELKKKPEITGNDFLPLVLKLDDLMAHLRSVREMVTRLTTLKGVTESPPPAPASPVTVVRAIHPPPVIAVHERTAGTPLEDLSPTLQAMAERLGQDHRKRFTLTVNGLNEVPPPYFTTVKNCLIQMLRNAAVHGIETSEVRRAQTKVDVGAVRVEFRKASEGYELMFEDDGAGISLETLKTAAVRKQIISAEEAARMDARAVMALIFRPGFSTQEEVSMDAGRGVGMDVVARSVQALGGKIGVSTNPGRFTRFKIVLPAVVAASA